MDVAGFIENYKHELTAPTITFYIWWVHKMPAAVRSKELARNYSTSVRDVQRRLKELRQADLVKGVSSYKYITLHQLKIQQNDDI